MIHVSAAVLTGLFFRRSEFSLSEPRKAETPGIAEALVASVRQSVSAVLSVCGFVVCFCVLSGLLDALGFWNTAAAVLSRTGLIGAPDARALLIGLLELSSGVGALRGLPPSGARFVLAAFLCGWGGLSVQFQTMAVLAETDLDARAHIVGRLFSALISALLALGLFRVISLLPSLSRFLLNFQHG